MDKAFLQRCWRSAVVWSWAFNALRLASVVLILPLLSRLLSTEDLGFYFALVSLIAFVPLLDVGFLPAISRSISYAVGGARELKAHGMESEEHNLGAPNFPLLWRLMFTTRSLYRRLSLGALLLIGCWGTYVVGLRINETSNPNQAWLAWGLTLAGTIFEMYSGWWNAYLRGLNQVLLATRILSATYFVRLVLACALLLAGGGLLSVPLATLVSSFLQRELSKRHSLKFLAQHPCAVPTKSETRALLGVLWPNSWRVGVHCLTNFLVPHLCGVFCLNTLGLAANSRFGLSVQIVNLIQSMSGVWLQVKWPAIGQHLSRRELSPIRAMMRHRLLLQTVSFAIMAGLAIPLTPWLLDVLKTDKSLLPPIWIWSLALYSFAELHTSSWATFVSLGNRLPFLPITVATNIVAIALAWTLLNFTNLGFGALILGPLLASGLHNYWRWPIEGTRTLDTTWWRFLVPAGKG